jgi:hypothetical protein
MTKNEFNKAALTPMFFGLGLLLATAGCTPTVKVQAPDKPIEINMNIKIEQEVRIKVEKDLESAFAEDPELFGVTK